MNNAEVLIKFKGDTASASKSLDGLKSKIGGLASGIAKGIGVATATATAAITSMTKKAIDSFAEYEQLYGGVETLFGTRGAKNVEEYAKTVGKSVDAVKDEYEKLAEAEETVSVNSWKAFEMAGLSANEYMNTVNSFAASLKQSINDPIKLAEAADQAVIDMSDNANKMGTAMESIQNAYQGFAKQNYTMLDNLKLGYGGTKTEMERLLADASKLTGVKYDIKNLGDVYQAIHVIQTELGITGTTAKEASSTIQGSLNMTKSAFNNLMTSIGTGMWTDEVFDDLVNSIMTLGDNLMPVIERVLDGIAKLIPNVVDKIVAILPGLMTKILPSLIKGAVALVNGLIRALPMLIQTLLPHLITGLIEITNQILLMLPEIILMIAEMLPTLIPTIIDAILTTIPMLLDHLPEFVQAGFQLLVGIVSGLISALPKVLQFGIKFVGSLLSGIVSVIGKIPEAIFGVFNKVGTGLGNIADGIKNVFKRTFEAIANIVKTPINWLIGGLNTFIRAINKIKIPDWVPLVGGLGFHIPEIPKLATGTNYVPEDTLAMIHKGEAVVPKKFNPYANGINTQTMGAMQNSSQKQIINVYVESNTDPLGQVVNSIKTFGGGAKNDYNYGYGGM